MAYYNRRNFLRSAAAFSAAIPMMSHFMAQNAYAASADGYKALVCLNFGGGIDGSDWLMPTDAAPYGELATLRQPLLDTYNDGSRLRENLLSIGSANNGVSYGLPSNLTGFHDLITQGKGKVIANIGTLVEPVTRESWDNGSAARPRKLFSHNDQLSMWLTGDVEGAQTGWAGRFMDNYISGGVQDGTYSTLGTSASRHAFMTGIEARELVIPIGTPQAPEYIRRRSALSFQAGVQPAFNQLMLDHLRADGVAPANPYARDLSATAKRGIDNLAHYIEVLEQAAAPTTTFSNTTISQQFAQVAKTISRADAFGQSRQIFYVQAPGGFDTHGAQSNSQDRLTETSNAVAEFMAEIEAMGMAEDVTVFTTSDFGRTLSANGGGTDHGWGSHHFVFGGAIDNNTGSNIIGTIPNYNTESGLYTGRRGRLIPDISVEQYAATLGRWFGLNETDLLQALPNLVNFDQKNLGVF